ncbi:MAG TPA: hypothetical protein VNH18_16300 [Bryobacteraceae bacterium]|nr:hypothetical protein [Bryobacteraceae bacterium]
MTPLGGDLPGIDSRPDVCAGEHSYPSLRAEDLVNAWGYVRVHREEIQAQIRDNESA